MSNMCMILNVIVLIAYAIELYFDYDIILDKGQPMKARRKYALRLVVNMVIVGLVLITLYKVFGVNQNNLGYYMRYGKTG